MFSLLKTISLRTRSLTRTFLRKFHFAPTSETPMGRIQCHLKQLRLCRRFYCISQLKLWLSYRETYFRRYNNWLKINFTDNFLMRVTRGPGIWMLERRDKQKKINVFRRPAVIKLDTMTSKHNTHIISVVNWKKPNKYFKIVVPCWTPAVETKEKIMILPVNPVRSAYGRILYSINKISNPTLHISRCTASSEEKSARPVIQKSLVQAHCSPLFFFQQCSLVGIRLYRWRPTISITEAFRIK